MATPVAIVTALCLAAAVLQPAQPANPPGAAPARDPGTVVLSPTPFRVEAVGLSMYLPEGAKAETTTIGERTSSQIVPAEANPTWLMLVETPKSTNARTSPEEVATAVLNQLLGSVGVVDADHKLVSTRGTVLKPVSRLSLATDTPGVTLEGARFYVKLPGQKNEAPVVRAYTAVSVGSGRFVTFELRTTEGAYPKAAPIYETIVGTARFEDPSALEASRGAAVEAGVGLLASLGQSDYDALFGARQDAWFRIYTPSKTGVESDAKELGYKRFQAWAGSRGELDPARDRSSWSAADRQPGYLIRIEARQLLENQMIDSSGTYFMSADRKEEAWVLANTIRDTLGREKPATLVETGARTGAKMNVAIRGTGQENTSVRPFIPENGYLTQVEQFVLPQLLTKRGIAGEYGFYSYNSKTSNVRVRRDVLSHPGTQPSLWQLVSRMAEDEPSQTALYSERGQLMRLQMANGGVVEPIELARLVELWKAKNLPMK